MKLKPEHYSALGLGITAIVGIAAIWYYRNSAASQAAAAPSPLFQTAAVPSYSAAAGTDTGTTAAATGTGGATSGAGGVTTTGIDAATLAAIAGAQINSNFSSGLSSDTSTSGTAFTAETTGLLSQILGQLPSLTPGNQNVVSAMVSSPQQNLSISAIYGQNPGPFYQPPSGPTPLSYAAPQATQVATGAGSSVGPALPAAANFLNPAAFSQPDQTSGGGAE